jgi:hypothetical protein
MDTPPPPWMPPTSPLPPMLMLLHPKIEIKMIKKTKIRKLLLISTGFIKFRNGGGDWI